MLLIHCHACDSHARATRLQSPKPACVHPLETSQNDIHLGRRFVEIPPSDMARFMHSVGQGFPAVSCTRLSATRSFLYLNP